ncbi:unnamed protein product [Larinioides sclopetarius]|uniref:Uncharacterized protein n=1 Tax=Larinioides sclopetarius TaxID=280406 RepID=A0AAV1YT78_9ARAC
MQESKLWLAWNTVGPDCGQEECLQSESLDSTQVATVTAESEIESVKTTTFASSRIHTIYREKRFRLAMVSTGLEPPEKQEEFM